MNIKKLFLGIIASIFVFSFIPQESHAAIQTNNIGVQELNFDRDASIQKDVMPVYYSQYFSSYPPSSIYIKQDGYGGFVDLQSVTRKNGQYWAKYYGELEPICVGGFCPNFEETQKDE